jgi:hypothetical protein
MGKTIDTVAHALLPDQDRDNGFLRNALGIYPHAISTWSIMHWVDSIRSHSRPGQIDLLRVFGHGTDGEQNVAGGFGGSKQDIARDPACCIMFLGGVRLNQVERLATLTDRFGLNATVQLHGCHTGRGAKGRSLCLTLAKLWDVRVSAGFESQFPDKDARYEGNYITAWPNGYVMERRGDSTFKVVTTSPHAAKEEVSIIGTHTVGNTIREQDWLSNISKKWYGELLLWPIIFDFNKSAEFSNQNKMKPGQVLRIPSIAGMSDEDKRIVRQRGRDWR